MSPKGAVATARGQSQLAEGSFRDKAAPQMALFCKSGLKNTDPLRL